MPSSSITYSSATTRGRDVRPARGRWPAPARRSASVCRPAPTSRKASAAPTWPTPGRAVRLAGEHQQRERHDRQAAELQQRAEPDVGHAPPAEDRAVRVGAEADQRAERREHQRQRHHQRDQPGRHAQLDDHHAVERAGEQHHRHAHRDLEQRQPQQPAERQLGAAASANGRKRGPSARQLPRTAMSLSAVSSACASPAPARCRSRWRCARVRAGAPVARAPARLDRRAQRRPADRLDRGRAVAAREQPADGMHRGEQPACAARR